MKLKPLALLAAGAAAYYLFRTPKGRVRLEQLKTSAGKFARRPEVQNAASRVADQARSQAGNLPGFAGPVVKLAADQVDRTIERTPTDPA